MELEADGLPITVSLVKPTAIHTPFPENAKNYLPYEPQLPPPVYAPELVAEAILYCAENGTPEFFVGEMAKLHSSMAKLAPRTGEKVNEMMIDSFQNSGEPAHQRSDGLYEPNSNLRERGARERYVVENSLYQKSQMHPILTGALAVGAGLGIAAWLSSRKKYTDGYDAQPKSKSPEAKTFDAAQISKGAEVLSADNQHVGTVDAVEGAQIKLTRKDSTDAKHHFIPLAWVASAREGKVRLSRNAYVVRGQWGTQENENVMNAGEFGSATGGI
jgi:hypothetical protein